MAKTPMDLKDLTKQQLIDVFLSVNSRYLSTRWREVNINVDGSDFMELRNELGEVLNELQRRRQQAE
jgi:hypothetical protein